MAVAGERPHHGPMDEQAAADGRGSRPMEERQPAATEAGPAAAASGGRRARCGAKGARRAGGGAARVPRSRAGGASDGARRRPGATQVRQGDPAPWSGLRGLAVGAQPGPPAVGVGRERRARHTKTPLCGPRRPARPPAPLHLPLPAPPSDSSPPLPPHRRGEDGHFLPFPQPPRGRGGGRGAGAGCGGEGAVRGPRRAERPWAPPLSFGAAAGPAAWRGGSAAAPAGGRRALALVARGRCGSSGCSCPWKRPGCSEGCRSPAPRCSPALCRGAERV